MDLQKIENAVGFKITRRFILSFAVVISILFIVLYIYFTGTGHEEIMMGVIGGLVASSVVSFVTVVSQNFAKEGGGTNASAPKSLLRVGGASISAHTGEVSVDMTAYPPVIQFSANQESAGGVPVEDPGQHLYTVFVMKIPAGARDMRNMRELKFLAGNVPITVVDADSASNVSADEHASARYELKLNRGAIAYDKLKKDGARAKNYYIRIARQRKPIDYTAPKDPKNYDIDQVMWNNVLQSVGELYHEK